MNRNGFTFPMLLLSCGAAGLLTLSIIAASTQRAREARIHQARVQGREWCLGAQQFLEGTRYKIGNWIITCDAQRTTRAQGPLGTYTIDANGQEKWIRQP